MIGRLRSWFTPETRASTGYTAQILAQQLAAATGIGSIRESAIYKVV